MKKRGKVSKKAENSRKNLIVFLVSILVVYSVALISGIFTSASVDSLWYNIIKPALTPPNWVFIIVWNVIYFLIVLSLYFSWTASKNHKSEIIAVFGINLFLNIAWTFLFFTLQNPFLAFFGILALWVSIIFMIFITCRINKIACYLLIPYFFWVSFAAALNFLMAFPGA